MRIAVTGATGHLGGLVIESLLNKNVEASDIVAIVRNEEKAKDLAARGINIAVAAYDDEAALKAALNGVDRLVFVSASEVGKRVEQHSNIIAAAKEAGVSFIAYTSLLNLDSSELFLAPEHQATEKMLAESGIDHANLRNGWYWENYAAALETGKAMGKFFSAAGEAKVAGAARKDFAEAAAVVVTTDGHAGKTYELAGAPALTYPEIAAQVGEVLGTDVEYVNLTVEEYEKSLLDAGLPADFAAGLAGADPVIEKGALYSESTDLQDLIGRPASTVAETFK
ncbi:SDR family oxidoreductase [Corynebacterium casei]|uniref:SDR family oxidoreductase n=1 Tax=Corynebacterium casei TaxID=160386 RepID=UPI0018665EEF|nr:SDR family oxidoreductase [Corynebacterium casei]MDN6627507.1 SDR family oxidoreductase [Corynebacterium casei]MDN6695285.1 SDR family oxidoreductase [Corynebacterium casei]